MIPGKLIPDIHALGPAGEVIHLWDYRQRSHVALLILAKAESAKAEELRASSAESKKTWDWLNVTILITDSAQPPLEPGIYLIDRYGIFIEKMPFSAENWAAIENLFISYEAKHC